MGGERAFMLRCLAMGSDTATIAAAAAQHHTLTSAPTTRLHTHAQRVGDEDPAQNGDAEDGGDTAEEERASLTQKPTAKKQKQVHTPCPDTRTSMHT